MRLIKGQVGHARWKRGHSVTPQQAIAASCYNCNNRELEPWAGEGCNILWEHSPYNKEPQRQVSDAEMELEIEQDDWKLMPERLRTISLPYSGRSKNGDQLFDVNGFAEYLMVSPKWVYDHIHELSHFKSGEFLCFNKNEIDNVIDRLALNERAKKV